MSNQTFLIGTGSQYIYACRLTSNGQLQLLTTNNSAKGPSWLLAKDNFLYVAIEQEDKIETFTIDDRNQGKLTSKGTVSSKGSTPCSLAIDPTGKWLAVANYGGLGQASFALIHLNESNLLEENGPQAVFIDGHGPNKDRQDRSHCHQVQFYEGYLYGVDLGTDTVNVYHYSDTTGEVRLNRERIQTQPGAGPRHLLFHPDESLAFLCNEVNSTTNVYRSDSKNGQLELKQTISTRQENAEKNSTKENTVAELHISPDKKYLLVSNRGDDNIVIYNINSKKNDEVLTVKDYLDIHGSGPRYFTFDPTGKFLLIANQDTNNITCFSYNKDNGTFTFIAQLSNVERPQHILFIA